jgi:two-component system sensor histidine kinase AtoS
MRLSWLSHITARYAIILVAATLLPMMIVVVAYDRYASGLLSVLTGTQLERRVAIMHSRLASFVEARFAQLDTLANYPDLASAVTAKTNDPGAASVRAVLAYEADNPDLYGILIFKSNGAMVAAVPSQSAAGAPYWGGRWEPLREDYPRIETVRGIVIGPVLPADDRPGSVLLLRSLPSTMSQQDTAIALHVRLSSLTELLGERDANDFVRPMLMTPGDTLLSVIGRPEPVKGELLFGPEVLPGWKPVLALETGHIARPLATVREALLAAAAVIIAVVSGLVFLLGARLNRRIRRLVDGSIALAEGRLDTRIIDEGRDEVSILAGAFNGMAARLRNTISATVEIEKMALLGRFATSFAHEVRNPLAAMKTAVQSLMATDQDPRRCQLLAGVDEEVDRLDDALRNFLAYARPAPPMPRRVIVEDVLRRIQIVVAHQLEKSGIAFVWLGETQLALRVDPTHLQQILMNLIVNAIDGMPKGGRITVRIRRGGGNGIIEMSDTGEGIAADMLDKVVEPFVTTRPEGSGLGLPISRQLAEINGGTLTLASAPGHGVTVTLVLPRDEELVS